MIGRRKRVASFQTCFLVLVVGFLGMAGNGFSQSFDKIYLKDSNEPQLGRIVKETMKFVKFYPVRRGQVNKIQTMEENWKNIERIHYGSFPQRYQNAVEAFDNGQYQRALDFIDKMNNRKFDRKVVPQRVLLLRIQILQKAKNLSKVRDQLQQYIDTFQSKYKGKRGYTHVTRIQLDLLLSAEQYNQAFSLLQRLKNQRKYPQRFQDRMTFLKGFIREQQGRFQEATTFYEKVKEGQTRQYAMRGKLGLGRCHLSLKEFGKAEGLFRRLQSKAKNENNQEVLVGLHNGLGQILYRRDYQDSATSDQEKIQTLKDSLLHFLRAILLYQVPEGSTLERERALMWAVRCFYELSQLVPSKKLQNKYTREALMIMNRLKSRFPDSIFLGRAREVTRKIR